MSSYTYYGLDTIEINGREYAIALTDDEADNAVTQYIEDSLWAFNPDFLAGETGLPQQAFAALSPLCEDANEPVLAMGKSTCGLESLVDSAIGADGRGHFLASYDGDEQSIDEIDEDDREEIEDEFDFSEGGYLYRIN